MTIRDVAAISGVSVGTVSRSLNAPETVRASTLARVRATIRDLGFQPDARAQNMRRRNTLTIGFVVNDILNPIHARVFKSAEAELRDNGYWLHLANTEGQARREAEAVEVLQAGRVDGLLLTINSEQDLSCLERLRALRVPSVLLDREIALDVDAVRTDHAAGMEQAVEYLVGLGHRRIALITASVEILPGRERVKGFQRALHAHNIACPPDFVRAKSLSAEFGFREALDLLDRPDRPTALVAGGNQLLAGVLKAAQQRVLSVPTDLSVVTCDRTELSEIYAGGVTTIDRDVGEIGRTAAQLLLERLSDLGERPVRRVVLPTRLVLGSSCGPPAAGR